MTEVMWTVSQIAARDNVSKAAVSKTIKRMLESRDDVPVERGSQGQVSRVSLAHYDHFRQRHINPAKAGAPIRPTEQQSPSRPLNPDESFEEARRQSEWLKVGREQIRHKEECGELLRRDKIVEAVKEAGLKQQAIIRRLQNKADDIALAVSKEGVHGARVALRNIAFELGNEIADKLAELAALAPDSDPLIVPEEEDAGA